VSAAPRCGGVVLRVEGALRFVPAATAVRIAPAPEAAVLTRVPGAPADLIGIALNEGVILPVVAIGRARREMLVCQHGGDLVGLVGGEVVQTGVFDAAGDGAGGVTCQGEIARVLDVASVYAQIQPRQARLAG
jgi:hypothetical protein